MSIYMVVAIVFMTSQNANEPFLTHHVRLEINPIGYGILRHDDN
jgi:hypothetical protein